LGDLLTAGYGDNVLGSKHEATLMLYGDVTGVATTNQIFPSPNHGMIGMASGIRSRAGGRRAGGRNAGSRRFSDWSFLKPQKSP